MLRFAHTLGLWCQGVLFASQLCSVKCVLCLYVHTWLALRFCYKPIPLYILWLTDHLQVYNFIYNGEFALTWRFTPIHVFCFVHQFAAKVISYPSSICHIYHYSARLFSLQFISYDSIKDYLPSFLISYKCLLFTHRANYLPVAANIEDQCGALLKRHISHPWGCQNLW